MKSSDILRGEIIGLNIEIIKEKKKKMEGIKGKVIDETRNMIMVDGARIIKDQVILHIQKGNKKFEVDGRLLVGRPEERLKKIRRL